MKLAHLLLTSNGVLLCNTDEPAPHGSMAIVHSSLAPTTSSGDETVAQVEVLINLRDSTGYEGWTKNKEGWDQLKAGMSGKQAKAIFEACNNKSVYFDDEGRPWQIALGESGLSGECPRFSSRHQSLIAHGNTHLLLAGPLPDMSPLTHLICFWVHGNKCTGATMQ